MNITGKLRQDLIDGKVVLFLGAGASQAAGLHGTAKLAESLYVAAGSPQQHEGLKNDLVSLVARLDEDPHFTRAWVNKQLIDYFLDRRNYSNLQTHKTLLKLPLAAVFTTNYDSCLEYAGGDPDQRAELLPIVDGSRRDEVFHPPPGCLQYFKIHGCCRELRNHPTIAPDLVITRGDFRTSVTRKKNFYERLSELVWEGSVVFIGFQAQREESDHMMSYVGDVYNSLLHGTHTPFRPFAVLPQLSERSKQELEDAYLTPLEGAFEDFINSAYEITNSSSVHHGTDGRGTEQDIALTVQGRSFHISRRDIQQYSRQFTCLYDGLKEELRIALNGVTDTQIAQIWKDKPNSALLAAHYYIERDQFPELKDTLNQAIDGVKDDKVSQVIWLIGKRNSGKSTVAYQLAWHAYYNLALPTIFLTEDATYSVPTNTKEPIEISGWDEQLIDKFLSLSSAHDQEDDPRIVPIILADHVVHRANALEHLLHYLEDHKKPSILILTISDEELAIAQGSLLGGPSARSIARLKHMFSGILIEIKHRLSDDEIQRLFEVVARVDRHIALNSERLIQLAKDEDYCDRDFLLILYTWFDQRFRRFEEIVADEIAILEQSDEIKQVYLATALFHQYHLQPRLALCAKAVGMSIESYNSLRRHPLFHTLITVQQEGTDTSQAFGTTRHIEFSRRIVSQLMPDVNEQVALMVQVLSHCSYSDLEFARGFMNYVYDYGIGLTYDQVRKLKEATEGAFEEDYLLNHQFAAYLIRENQDLVAARYYLDKAQNEYYGNPSIIHSIGNLHFRKYRDLLPDDPEEARKYFEIAREYFAKSRALQFGEEEHGYYTEIAMLKHRMDNEQESLDTRAIIEAERHALLFEALRVVPKARQNLLRGQLGDEKPFQQLPSLEQESLKKLISSGEASYILLEYYGRSLLISRNAESWRALRNLIGTYWKKASSDLPTAIILCLLAKQAFIKSAQTRFELLQSYYDKAIIDNQSELNFVLRAEYTRLIMVDAFVLGRFNFLRNSVVDLIELYRQRRPRFLGDEYILANEYYRFDESDINQNMKRFLDTPITHWSHPRYATRFEEIAFIPVSRTERYIKIEIDRLTRFFIRTPRQEIASRTGRVKVNFAIKYTYDGFIATEFVT